MPWGDASGPPHTLTLGQSPGSPRTQALVTFHVATAYYLPASDIKMKLRKNIKKTIISIYFRFHFFFKTYIVPKAILALMRSCP